MFSFFSLHLQEADGVVVEALRGVVQDALQRPLDNGAGSQNPLTELHQALTNLQR